MKTLIKFVTVFLTILLFTGCQYIYHQLFPPVIPTLPAETQTGKNTFGCYINGELFLNNALYSIGRNLDVWYGSLGLDEIDSIFIIQAGSRSAGYLRFCLAPDIVRNNKINEFVLIDKVEYYTSNNSYVEGNNISSIIFTKIDTISRILSGRFEFDLVKGNGDILKFTEGRFDCEF